MNLTSPKEIKELLSQHFVRPSKTMGQNFLIDKNALDKIIKTADLTKEDVVLEIGPGIGTLTKELARVSKKVIAVEKDRAMLKILKETLKDYDNVEIIQDDVLKFSDYSLLTENPDFIEDSRQSRSYKLVANIPYYLTSPLIRKFLESENKPSEIILMIQKEVAQRICSAPPNMSLLAVSVQFYAKAKIISYVSKNCFWPAPKIDSAIIKITPYPKNGRPSVFMGGVGEEEFIEKFFTVVKAGFSQPRKQLTNNLSKGLNKSREEINSWLLENGINPKQRAETLSIKNWIDLTKNFPL